MALVLPYDSQNVIETAVLSDIFDETMGYEAKVHGSSISTEAKTNQI